MKPKLHTKIVGLTLVLALLSNVFYASPVSAQTTFAQSVNVAVVNSLSVRNGGAFPTTTSGPTGSFTDFNFYTLSVSNVSSAALGPGGVCGPAGCDTVLLNVASSGMACNVNSLSPQQKTDLVNFVEDGYKLIIYDSECVPQDYSWLPYTFTTANPGAQGAQGTLTIVEENTLSSNDPSSSYYINASMLGSQTDAVGDMNVMTTFDPNWLLDMSGTNILGVTGPVHTYAKIPPGTDYGLIIYNGLDVDYMNSGTVPDSSTPGGNLAKIWLHELQQPFNPSQLPGGVPVVGIALTPITTTLPIGQSHTVTATLTDLLANPQPGIAVFFSIDSGPNAGVIGVCSFNNDCTTDTNGQVSFTYSGIGGVGIDRIKGCFTNQQGQAACSQSVEANWIQGLPYILDVAVLPSSTVEMKEDSGIWVFVFDPLMPTTPTEITVKLQTIPSVTSTKFFYRNLNIQVWRGDHWEPFSQLLESTQLTKPGGLANYNFGTKYKWDWIPPLNLETTIGELLLKFIPSFDALITITKLGVSTLLLAEKFDNTNEISFSYSNISPSVIDPQGYFPKTVVYKVPQSKVNWFIISVTTSIASTITSMVGGYNPPILIAEIAVFAASKVSYLAAYDPDPNYTEKVLPIPIEAPELETVPSGALKSAALSSLEFLSEYQASVQCYLKAEGAREVGDWPWVVAQYSDSRKYLNQSMRALSEFREYWHSGTFNLNPVTTEQVEEFKSYLQTNGLPPVETSMLTRLGFSEEEMKDLKDLLLEMPTDFVVSQNYKGVEDSLDATADSISSQSTELLKNEVEITLNELGGNKYSLTEEELNTLNSLKSQVEVGLTEGVKTDSLYIAIVSLRDSAESMLIRTNNLEVVLPYYEFAMSAEALFQTFLPHQMPPSLTIPGGQNIHYGALLSFNVTATDPDDASDTLTFSATGLPNDLVLTNNGNGTATASGVVNVAPGTYIAEITVADPGGLSDTKPVTIEVVYSVPTLPILDDFNRANGSIGKNWSGKRSGYRIWNNQLRVKSAGTTTDIYWKKIFEEDQEAYITFARIKEGADEYSLLLKSQSKRTWGDGVLEVQYSPKEQTVQVWTWIWPGGWTKHGDDIPVTFVDGDTFGARARPDGIVEIYRNGELLDTRDITSWPYYSNGGYIGLWFLGARNTVLDDFGGGNVPAFP